MLTPAGTEFTRLSGVNLVVSTVWREVNYLDHTLSNLMVEYPRSAQQPVYLVAGSSMTTHLEEYYPQPWIVVVEMGPTTWSWIKDSYTHYRATWNYYRCLTQPVAGARGTLVLEDDIRFAQGWCSRLDNTVATLEAVHSSNFVLAVYGAWFSVVKAKQSGRLYVEYPHESFCGTQGIYYPADIRQEFAKYLKAHGLVANEDHYDRILRKYLIQSGIPLFATTPCLIQHMGKKSVIETFWHESSDFVENVAAEPLRQAE